MNQVVRAQAPEEAAPRSDERLAELIPQRHPESVIRGYLVELHKRLSR